MAGQMDGPLDGRRAAPQPDALDGGIYAEGRLICLRPRRTADGVTLGGTIAEAQDVATAAEVARRCAMHDAAMTAMRLVDTNWSINGTETPGTMGLFYPAWQIEAWTLIRVLLKQAKGA